MLPAHTTHLCPLVCLLCCLLTLLCPLICHTCAGKTLVYSLPLICIAAQDELLLPLQSGEGPLGLIICPSRELASQTVEVISQYTEALARVCGAYSQGAECHFNNTVCVMRVVLG